MTKDLLNLQHEAITEKSNSMNYIVYTTEGYTELPVGTHIENCQIIAFEENTKLSIQELKEYYAEQLKIRCDKIFVVEYVPNQ